MTKPMIHVADRLTQITLLVVGGQQALLHKSFRDSTRDLLAEVTGPDRTLKDRQNPIKTLASQCCTGFGTGTAGSVTMPQRWHAGPATGVLSDYG
jgi:hypothetical protein